LPGTPDTSSLNRFPAKTSWPAVARAGTPTSGWSPRPSAKSFPDEDKEKQLMQGLLNQGDQAEEEARKGKLF
jgi:hypothetical protein